MEKNQLSTTIMEGLQIGIGAVEHVPHRVVGYLDVAIEREGWVIPSRILKNHVRTTLLREYKWDTLAKGVICENLPTAGARFSTREIARVDLLPFGCASFQVHSLDRRNLR